jgi:hypothetical protein
MEGEWMAVRSGGGWMVWLREDAGLVFLFFFLLLFPLIGCGAGSGSDDDEVDGPGGIQPTLQSIQTNVFTPICAVPGCHVGAGAQQGLMLDSANNSFLDLVGVDSSEIPSLLRVDPGNPDNSYLVQRIEGAPNIAFAQMPLNQPPLSTDQVDAIRQWILNGAQQ